MADIRGLLDSAATYDPNYVYGALLPFRKNKQTKDVELALPGLFKDMAQAVTAPMRAWEGKIDPMSPEAVAEAANIAGLLGEGSVAATGTRKMPRGQVNMFIGKNSKVWDAPKADEAQKMLAAGVDPKEVWKKTGTFKGVDGALRQEIPDNKSALISKNFETTSYSSSPNKRARIGSYGTSPDQTKISDGFNHPLLFDAYPDTKDIRYGASYEYGPSSWGFTDAGTGKTAATAGGEYTAFPEKISVGTGYDETIKAAKDKTKSTTLHELQHAIQEREGWARGGSPESFSGAKDMVDALAIEQENIPHVLEYWRRIDSGMNKAEAAKGLPRDSVFEAIGYENSAQAKERANKVANEISQWADIAIDPFGAYKKLAGEAEARLTQSRMNMTMPERLQVYPYDMLDVPQDQLIVRWLLGN